MTHLCIIINIKKGFKIYKYVKTGRRYAERSEYEEPFQQLKTTFLQNSNCENVDVTIVRKNPPQRNTDVCILRAYDFSEDYVP